jgi:hypothetical protein
VCCGGSAVSPRGRQSEVRGNGRIIVQEDNPKVFNIIKLMGKQDEPGEVMGLGCVKTLVTLPGGPELVRVRVRTRDRLQLYDPSCRGHRR